jgi:proteasome lid subunit RPN8/RPN11
MPTPKTVKLTQSQFAQIIAHAKSCLPEEACGLLGGKIEGSTKVVTHIYNVENIDHTNEHFSMAPKDQLAAVKKMRAAGEVPLGNWHSHPETPSRPSDEDKRLAYDSKASYLILSLMNADSPVLHAFHIEGDVSSREMLIIVED